MTTIPSSTSANYTISATGGSFTLASGSTRGSAAVVGNGGKYDITITGSSNNLINNGVITGYSGGIGVKSTGNTITNRGTIIGGGPDAYSFGGVYTGVNFGPGATNGVLINYGIITNGDTHVSGSGNTWAVWVQGGAGVTVNNKSTGTISPGGVYVSGYTISPTSYASAHAGTVINAGLIQGFNNSFYPTAALNGIFFKNGGTVTNLSGGRILANGGSYGIEILGANGTIENAGTIGNASHTAVIMGAALTNLFILDSTGVDLGIVNGGAGGHNTFEFGTAAALTTYSNTGNITNFNTISFLNGSTWDVQGNAAFWAGETLGNVGQTDTIDITGFTATNTGVHTGTTALTLTNGVTNEVIHFATATPSFTIVSGAFGTELLGICFCPGTKIRTPNGEVQVEDLSVGDTVVTLGGNTQNIAWIGKGKVLATRGKRGPATPVIVRKGALANNVPNADLHVTKGHAFYFDGVLIPVEFLINHKTILWDDRAQEVEIYHVELATHDVLFANGAPAESYRDDGNRWLFHNANEGWDQPDKPHYAPVLTGGAMVDAVWQTLLDRAGGKSRMPTTEDSDLHLLVDGLRVDAIVRQEGRLTFRLPAAPGSVRVVSRDGVPAELGLVRDPRSLGVALRRVMVTHGRQLNLIEADDERLTDGFHDYEPAENIRWTNGNAALPIEAFAGFGPNALVELHLAGATVYPLLGEEAAA